MTKNIKHFTIPVFVPEEACPNRCVYCNQHSISGSIKAPSKDQVIQIIEEHLQTIPAENAIIELGFFGGNFTGIDIKEQEQYLQVGNEYIKQQRIRSIRLSTRPDYINKDILEFLKSYQVETIELGLQSMDDEILKTSGRGHTAEDTVKASEMINKKGFRLGLQMMIGLPGDTFQKSFRTAKRIVELGAMDTRIYPTLVIKGTELEKLYKQKRYKALTLEEAVSMTKDLYLFFEDQGINIIRVGLHPSKELTKATALVAGPYHPSFRELVLTEIWKDVLQASIDFQKAKRINIFVPKGQLNYAIGYDSINKKKLQKVFHKLTIKEDEILKGRQCYVDYY